MQSIEVGDIIRSKTHRNWTGEVIKVHEKGHGFLISWFGATGGHIRTWAYIDDVILYKKTTSRFQKAIADRKQ